MGLTPKFIWNFAKVICEKFLRRKITLNWITFALLVQKFVKWETYTLSHGGVLVVPKVDLGTWEFGNGHGHWFVLGEFLHCGNKRKSHVNARKGFLGLFLQILPYFQWKLLKVAMFKYYVHKSYQYKTGFWKNIYNISRIEILMLRDFDNMRGFLFWIGPIWIK